MIKKITNNEHLSISDGFRTIWGNRSALGCMLSTVLRMASFTALGLYSSAFYRQVHGFSTSTTSIIVTLCALDYTFGSLSTGRIVRRLNRKLVTWTFLLLGSALIIVYTYASNVWVSLAAYFGSTFFLGAGASAGTAIFLEQEPRYRGTMMSFVSAFGSMGSALGAGAGGAALIAWGYNSLGLILGGLGVIGALLVLLMVQENKSGLEGN